MSLVRMAQWWITTSLTMWLARVCPSSEAKEKMLFIFLDLLNEARKEQGRNPKPLPHDIAEVRREIEF